MEANFKNLIQLQAYFTDENVCRTYLENQRWSGQVYCPYCGSKKVYTTKRKKRDGTTVNEFKCGHNECYKKFSCTTGTIFEESKLPLRVWFAAIYLITAHKKGISSHQLSRDLGITQKTAWFVLHRVREMLKEKNPDMLDNTVEIDETYVGGKDKNRHAHKRSREIYGGNPKTPVLSMVERGGKIRSVVLPDSTNESINPVIVSNVRAGATMITDERGGYKSLKQIYRHVYVNHSLDQFTLDKYHTNTVEGSFSLLKRGIYGIYHHVTVAHLQRYCDEFNYRYNYRHIKDVERFSHVLTHAYGRLNYRTLINK